MSASKSGLTDTAPEDSHVTINAEELIRTRTQLVTGLTSISAAINEFVRSYVQHTDKWIGKETQLPSGIDLSAISNLFAAGPSSADAFAVTSANAIGTTPGKRGPYKKGEKKKRKEKDPNAPKRPLTAFFLYSQYARSVVKQDFESSGVTPSAAQVSEEILRRWKNMSTEDQVPWKELYEKNADVYRKDTEAYKASIEAAPPEGHDEETPAAAGATEASDEEEAGPTEAGATSPVATAAAAAKTQKAAKGKGKKKEAAPAATATQVTDRDSPSAQLISRVSTVPVPGAQSEAPTTKTSKRKSEAADNKIEEPAKKKKRRTKAEKEADDAAEEAAKQPAKIAAAAEPAAEKKKKSRAKKDKSSD